MKRSTADVIAATMGADVGQARSTWYMVVKRWQHRADTPTRVGDRVLWELRGRFYDHNLRVVTA